MNPKLAALLSVFAVISGVVVLYTTDSGTTNNQLIDAGIQENHILVDGRCELLLIDGGYETRSGSAWANKDGGELVLFSEDLVDVKEMRHCRQNGAGGANRTKLAKITNECACRGAAGTCNKNGSVLEFGRIAGPIYGAPYNSFSGAGCVAMPCGEFSGLPIWPSGQCPREDAGVPTR